MQSRDVFKDVSKYYAVLVYTGVVSSTVDETNTGICSVTHPSLAPTPYPVSLQTFSVWCETAPYPIHFILVLHIFLYYASSIEGLGMRLLTGLSSQAKASTNLPQRA